MEGIEFDIEEDQGLRGSSQNEVAKPRHTFLFGLLAKIGIADRTVANVVLLGVAVIFLGISIFIYAGTSQEAIYLNASPMQVAAQQKNLSDMLNPPKYNE